MTLKTKLCKTLKLTEDGCLMARIELHPGFKTMNKKNVFGICVVRSIIINISHTVRSILAGTSSRTSGRTVQKLVK